MPVCHRLRPSQRPPGANVRWKRRKKKGGVSAFAFGVSKMKVRWVPGEENSRGGDENIVRSQWWWTRDGDRTRKEKD